jgi:hypothetical protein
MLLEVCFFLSYLTLNLFRSVNRQQRPFTFNLTHIHSSFSLFLLYLLSHLTFPYLLLPSLLYLTDDLDLRPPQIHIHPATLDKWSLSNVSYASTIALLMVFYISYCVPLPVNLF